MQRGTAIHRQAASVLSETRSKYILDPSKLSSLGRGLRRPKQVLDWLRAVCADPNRHSIGFAQCARPQTGTRLASRSVRGSKQALDWGVRDASQVCRVQSKFHLILVPGKLSQPRQRPARSKTEVCLASIPTDSDGSNALHGVKPPSSTRHSFLLDNNTSHGRTPSPSLLHNTPSYE